MIREYINYLYTDLIKYNSAIKNPNIDVVFEGGLFNGSYLLGILEYLKVLETNKYIQIKRISGTSIGSIIGLLYFLDYNPDDIDKLIMNTYEHFRTKYNVDIFDNIFKYLKQIITSESIKKINGRLYISYFDLKKNKHIVKSKYKNIDVLLDTIRKSCSMPFVVDNKLTYKNKYIDGLYPYVFKTNKKSRILYLNIHTFDKLFNMINIKDEKSNLKRIFVGIMDIHQFLSTNRSTNICSFTDSWSLIDNIKYKGFIYIIYIYYYLIYNIYVIHHNKVFETLYIYFLNTFCL